MTDRLAEIKARASATSKEPLFQAEALLIREDIPWLIEQVELLNLRYSQSLKAGEYYLNQCKSMQAVVDAARKWKAAMVGHGNLVDDRNAEEAMFNALMELDREG